MKAKSTEKRTAAQEALLALRRRLKLTQHQLAKALEVTPVTVARWETSRPPQGNGALMLARFARESGDPEMADVFLAAGTLPTQPRAVGQSWSFYTPSAEIRSAPGDTSSGEWQARQRERSPILALEQIWAAVKSDASLLEEYREIVEGLWKMHQGLLHKAVEGTGDLTELAAVHKYLRKERERLDERIQETKTQEKR